MQAWPSAPSFTPVRLPTSAPPLPDLGGVPFDGSFLQLPAARAAAPGKPFLTSLLPIFGPVPIVFNVDTPFLTAWSLASKIHLALSLVWMMSTIQTMLKWDHLDKPYDPYDD